MNLPFSKRMWQFTTVKRTSNLEVGLADGGEQGKQGKEKKNREKKERIERKKE